MPSSKSLNDAAQHRGVMSPTIERHGPAHRTFYVLFSDIDFAKKHLENPDYKYRDKASTERSLFLLIRQYSLQHRDQDGTLRDIEPAVLMKMLTNLMSHSREGRQSIWRPFEAMWSQGSDALRKPYFKNIKQNCLIYEAHNDLSTFNDIPSISLLEQVEHAILRLEQRRLTLGS